MFFNRKLQYTSFRSVLLIILWDIFLYIHIYFSQYFSANYITYSHFKFTHSDHTLSDTGYCLLFFLFPVFGLIADVKTGRYMSILTGMYLMFLAWIITGLAVIVKTSLELDLLFLILLFFAWVLQAIGYCSFRSNIIQFNIDQAIGASSNVLSAIIYYNCVCIPITFLLVEIGECLFKQFVIASYVVSGVAVSVVIITNILFKYWLDTTPHIINPVKLIAKVLNYARKNKCAKNRSALTYWEEDYPSRLDLGKEKYGGPFSEEQVESVKTLLRLIPLFICMVGMVSAQELRWNRFSTFNHDEPLVSCLGLNDTMYLTVASILVLTYQLVIYPCCYKWIPSMLKRIWFGLFFALLVPLYYVIIFACKEQFNLNSSMHIAIIHVVPEILFGIAFALVYPTSLEFTIAQSPHEMRGFVIGLWYAAFGLGYSISIGTKYSFSCNTKGDIICQNYYYYLCKSVIVLVTLVIFLVLSKRYKLRVRENEVNIHWIVEENYQKYMDQKQKIIKDRVRQSF